MNDLVQPKPSPNPLTVEVTRNGIVESVHRGSAAIVDGNGGVVASWGDIKKPVYPRSAFKALQAIPLVESGAADAAGMTDAEIALACSSHNGEAVHVDGAQSVLDKLGLSEADLECGPHWPKRDEDVHAMVLAGQVPDQRHNNCSGKHAGMLALAKHLKAPTKGYIRQDHPVQQRIIGVLERMCGYDLMGVAPGIDGCSAPNWPIPLENLAYAFAQFAKPSDQPERRAEAINRIRDAVFAHPIMVAGTGRFCTEVMEILGSRAFVKTGAEGVFCAALPKMGLGIALKCDDGATRGAEKMMAALLHKLDVIPRDKIEPMAPWLNPTLRNRNERIVGDIRTASSWMTF